MTHDDDNLPDMEKELARLTADAEAAIEQLRSKGLRDAMWLREGKISLSTLVRNVAYEAVGAPSRAMTVDEDRTHYEVFRNFVRQMKLAIRSGQLIAREPITMMPISVSNLEWWIKLDETALSCDAMCPHDRIVVRVGEAKTWIASLGAKLPGILAENGSESLRTSADRDMSQNPPAADTAEIRSVRQWTVSVAWQLRLIEHWPDIVRKHGPSVEARAVMRYVKKHDESGVIVAHPVADELMWRTQLGDTKIVGRKTFKNAVSLLRKRGYLKT
ncbi:hypothetical protein [Burkholderia pseudomallei]|uniref:hypothetical protein n=1 Tax=Burkholderia pseudomallei TaxID=28450 RepID=UPI0005B4EE09|nr:hypothetical protein [Burkholderia pseudomallei]RAQ85121.1 hypothetical protein A4G86_23050 [Burkholderia pseudomallei]RAQ91870.1 hypothetical protein A4G85_22385 [Burkholderia pseudomallei]